MDADELRRMAATTGFDVATLEKDYALAWLIHGIYTDPYLADTLIFKGGTAIRKVYAPEWRLSEDLDFTVIKSAGPEEIQKGFSTTFQKLDKDSVFQFAISKFHSNPEYLQARIQFRGPFAHKNTIKLDISLAEKLVSDPCKVQKPGEYDIPPTTVLIYSLNEILVEKIRSMLQRGYSRDYYDVWRLLKERTFVTNHIRDLLIHKCELTGVAYDPNLLFKPERLNEANRYWEIALSRLTPDLPPFHRIIDDLQNQLKFLKST